MVTRVSAPLIIVLFACTACFGRSGNRDGSSSIAAGGKEVVRRVGEETKQGGQATKETAKKIGKATGRAVTTGARRTGKAIKSVGAKTADADGRIGD